MECNTSIAQTTDTISHQSFVDLNSTNISCQNHSSTASTCTSSHCTLDIMYGTNTLPLHASSDPQIVDPDTPADTRTNIDAYSRNYEQQSTHTEMKTNETQLNRAQKYKPHVNSSLSKKTMYNSSKTASTTPTQSNKQEQKPVWWKRILSLFSCKAISIHHYLISIVLIQTAGMIGVAQFVSNASLPAGYSIKPLCDDARFVAAVCVVPFAMVAMRFVEQKPVWQSMCGTYHAHFSTIFGTGVSAQVAIFFLIAALGGFDIISYQRDGVKRSHIIGEYAILEFVVTFALFVWYHRVYHIVRDDVIDVEEDAELNSHANLIRHANIHRGFHHAFERTIASGRKSKTISGCMKTFLFSSVRVHCCGQRINRVRVPRPAPLWIWCVLISCLLFGCGRELVQHRTIIAKICLWINASLVQIPLVILCCFLSFAWKTTTRWQWRKRNVLLFAIVVLLVVEIATHYLLLHYEAESHVRGLVLGLPLMFFAAVLMPETILLLLASHTDVEQRKREGERRKVARWTFHQLRVPANSMLLALQEARDIIRYGTESVPMSRILSSLPSFKDAPSTSGGGSIWSTSGEMQGSGVQSETNIRSEWGSSSSCSGDVSSKTHTQRPVSSTGKDNNQWFASESSKVSNDTTSRPDRRKQEGKTVYKVNTKSPNQNNDSDVVKNLLSVRERESDFVGRIDDQIASSIERPVVDTAGTRSEHPMHRRQASRSSVRVPNTSGYTDRLSSSEDDEEEEDVVQVANVQDLQLLENSSKSSKSAVKSRNSALSAHADSRLDYFSVDEQASRSSEYERTTLLPPRATTLSSRRLRHRKQSRRALRRRVFERIVIPELSNLLDMTIAAVTDMKLTLSTMLDFEAVRAVDSLDTRPFDLLTMLEDLRVQYAITMRAAGHDVQWSVQCIEKDGDGSLFNQNVYQGDKVSPLHISSPTKNDMQPLPTNTSKESASLSSPSFDASVLSPNNNIIQHHQGYVSSTSASNSSPATNKISTNPTISTSFHDKTTESKLCTQSTITPASTLASDMHQSSEMATVDTSRTISSLWVMGDRYRLFQCCSNILHNALKYTKSSVQVDIVIELVTYVGSTTVQNGTIKSSGNSNTREPMSAMGTQANLTFRVKDDGIGIPLCKQPFKFQAYQRLQSQCEGTGLGLALVDAIMKKHRKGVLKLESPGEGLGSTCTLACELDMSDSPNSNPSSASAGCLSDEVSDSAADGSRSSGSQKRMTKQVAKQHENPIRILIVDDDKTTRRIMQRILKSLCSECGAAASGAEAIQVIKDRGVGWFTHITMDSSMPGMSGIEAVQRLRRMGFKGRIIGCTGNASRVDIAEFVQAGADIVLPKPITKNALAGAIIVESSAT